MKILGIYMFIKSNYLSPRVRDRLIDVIQNWDEIKDINNISTEKGMRDYIVKALEDVKY